MPTGPRRRGSAALTILTATLVAATVCGLGYAAQRLLLRTPTRAELVAAHAVGVAVAYRYVESEIHIPGRPVVHAACLEGWEPEVNGRPGGRGAQIVFSDGERLVLGDRRIARITKGPITSKLPPFAAVELAGCPRSLTNRIAMKLVDGSRSRAVPVAFAGVRALGIRMRTKRAVLNVYVNRDTLVPLGVRVETAGIVAWSRVHPVLMTPARQRAFRAKFNG
jgi:hypothetical protein